MNITIEHHIIANIIKNYTWYFILLVLNLQQANFSRTVQLLNGRSMECLLPIISQLFKKCILSLKDQIQPIPLPSFLVSPSIFRLATCLDLIKRTTIWVYTKDIVCLIWILHSLLLGFFFFIKFHILPYHGIQKDMS